MDFAQLQAAVTPALVAQGFEVQTGGLSGGTVLLGRRIRFRMAWMATQLKTTVCVTSTTTADAGLVHAFAREAFELAKVIKGGLPNGLQSGVGCVAVLVADRVDEAAAALALSKPTREWFQGISVFALVDLSTGRVHTYDGQVVVGRVYVPYLRSQRDAVTAAVLGAARSR